MDTWINLTPLVEFDNRFHLTGVTKILNTVSSFGYCGGLGEAAAWLCLRQDIYISLVSRQSLRTNLENFENSQSLQRDDDLSWASRIIFIVAKILRCAYLEHSCSRDATLQQLSTEIGDWQNNKPISFNPIKFAAPGPERDNRFPTIWMLSACHGKIWSHSANG